MASDDLTIKDAPVLVRSNVPSKKNYHDYKEELRKDFSYSCAYCSITEIEASGLSFEIDHYLPQKHFTDKVNDYENLYWSCQKCNSYKSDYCQEVDGLPDYCYIIRIDKENPRTHYYLNDDLLKEITNTGKFTINKLNLNRNALRRIRNFRRRFWDNNEYIARGVAELKSMNIDKLPIRLKNLVLRLRKQFSDQGILISKLIESHAKSHLLDNDDDSFNKIRRSRYLKELRTILPSRNR